MRLVLDTNVVVAAFRSRQGASNLVLRFADQGLLTPLCSTALFLEYEAVLSRRETRAVTGHTLEEVGEVMSALAAIAEGVDISFRTRPMLRDADDEMVFEVAVNGGADAIVTHNVKDFAPALRLGVTVATPGDIVRRLRNE
jgi:putative PIN family toxin of toxin-antitoxin system